MGERVLITGGAGFIGSHLARQLLNRGFEVTILDNFSPQIHGQNRDLPRDLAGSVRLIRGDIRDPRTCELALEQQKVVVHLAAETGTGQSMYQVRHYSEVNISGTATMMELLLSGRYPVQNLVVASSRAVYGEGAALCPEHGQVFPHARTQQSMEAGCFEPTCPFCGSTTAMLPTPEEAPFGPMSFYGLTKQVQEQMVLMYAETLGINGFALRYQNVYGPGQSLKNPYTGILAIFSSRARAHEPIYIFEDGKESRDFVYVDDVVEATMRCIEAPVQKPITLNVGTGTAVSVVDVVRHVTSFFSSSSAVSITGAFRKGDIRHNCANVDRLQATLGFVPQRQFGDGVLKFLAWAGGERIEDIGYDHSLDEMRSRGLIHG